MSVTAGMHDPGCRLAALHYCGAKTHKLSAIANMDEVDLIFGNCIKRHECIRWTMSLPGSITFAAAPFLRTATDVKGENVALLQRNKLIFGNYLLVHLVQSLAAKKPR